MLDLLFILSNLVILPFWLAMILFPRREFTNSLLKSHAALIVLALMYLLVFLGGFLTSIGQVYLLNFSSTELLAQTLTRPSFALVAWLHMICLDLVGGYWIYHESEKIGMGVNVMRVCLLFTFLLGPFGIFCFVVWRMLRASLRDSALAQK
ncbi:MAG: DUF4281 domain-containing protein [Anaerolinea sp.]|nr:DUF4281 domain-containing protein [Anaerolinea sp.]MCC6973711.1 DUF4281 domain-containing protein [Anaerolineae bacterium]CAG0987957.1 hypothetical protein ANRL4_02285 [Anaerolineae bacterium]